MSETNDFSVFSKTEEYLCPKGHRFSSSYFNPIPDLTIAGDQTGPLCPVCIVAYCRDHFCTKKVEDASSQSDE
jgi:hypothetical protein